MSLLSRLWWTRVYFNVRRKFSEEIFKEKSFTQHDVENEKLRKEENEKLKIEENEKLRKEESEKLRNEENEKLRKEHEKLRKENEE